MEKLRVGLIGAGFAGQFHMECWRRIYGVDIEVVGVTSKTKESREAFAKQWGLHPFDSYEDMLGQVDLLDVCTPPSSHDDAILDAAKAGVGVMCEKPLTGYFGPPDAGDEFRGDREPKEPMLKSVLHKLKNIGQAVRDKGVFFGYAENYVYTPSIQKEKEIIEKSGAQILRMVGEESHNGSQSPVYGIWRFAGGGSLIGKGCHPLSGMMYLKRIEGLATSGKAIRPKAVCARTHQLTRLPDYQDKGFIRTDYHDIEDYGVMHVTFEDGTVADVMTGEVSLGGLYDFVEVCANNHRTRCNISPVAVVDAYNPRGEQFKDIYLIEKASTQEGWSKAAADENFTVGYQAEMQDFAECAAKGKQPQSDLELAMDTTAVIYAAYLSDERKGAEVEVELI